MNILDALPAVSGEIIITAPDRFEELKTRVAAHPGGQLQHVYDLTGIVLIAYQFP